NPTVCLRRYLNKLIGNGVRFGDSKFPRPAVAASRLRSYNPGGRLFLTPRSRPLARSDMLARKTIFPNVIEMNFQAGEVLGCCVCLIFDGSDWLLVHTRPGGTREGSP